MKQIGQFLPAVAAVRRLAADIGALASSPFESAGTRSNIHHVAHLTSHGCVAERQNRYPSPLQGLGLIPVKALHPFWKGLFGADFRRTCANVIELHAQGVEPAATKSLQKGILICKRNSGSWQLQVFWAFRHAATPILNRASWGPARAQARPWCSAAMSPLARSSGPASTWLARTPRISADLARRSAAARNQLNTNGHSGRALPRVAFFLAATRQLEMGTGTCSTRF